MDGIQETFFIIKPDAVRSGLVGETIARIERARYRIVDMQWVERPDRPTLLRHYAHVGRDYGPKALNMVVKFMMSGPIVIMIIQGFGAIEGVRKLVGSTDPAKAAPGTIRGDFCHYPMNKFRDMGYAVPNLAHSSANEKEAEEEIAHWFGPDWAAPEHRTMNEWPR